MTSSTPTTDLLEARVHAEAHRVASLDQAVWLDEATALLFEEGWQGSDPLDGLEELAASGCIEATALLIGFSVTRGPAIVDRAQRAVRRLFARNPAIIHEHGIEDPEAELGIVPLARMTIRARQGRSAP